MATASPSRGDRSCLAVVGSGIQFVAHLPLATRAWIVAADKLLFTVPEPAIGRWLRQQNASAEALPYPTRSDGELGIDVYRSWVERLLHEVRAGQLVVAVFYGHPGVFVQAGHEAVARARAEGFEAFMLPGISALDCLIADLGLDPADNGLQTYDAGDFVLRPRRFDTATPLVLWQLHVVGTPYYRDYHSGGLSVLVELLTQHYGGSHEVVLYEAARYPGFAPIIDRLPLRDVSDNVVRPATTLVVPPLAPAKTDVGRAMQLTKARTAKANTPPGDTGSPIRRPT